MCDICIIAKTFNLVIENYRKQDNKVYLLLVNMLGFVDTFL